MLGKHFQDRKRHPRHLRVLRHSTSILSNGSHERPPVGQLNSRRQILPIAVPERELFTHRPAPPPTVQPSEAAPSGATAPAHTIRPRPRSPRPGPAVPPAPPPPSSPPARAPSD